MGDSIDLAALTQVVAAWLPAPEAEEKARRWLEVRHLFDRCTVRPPREGHRMTNKGWELRLVVPTDEELAQVREGLGRLDVVAGRPFSKRGTIVLPVYGRRYAWLPALMASSPPATGASRPPARPRARAAVAPPVRSPKTRSPKTSSPKTRSPKTSSSKTSSPKTSSPKTRSPKTPSPEPPSLKTPPSKTGSAKAGPAEPRDLLVLRVAETDTAFEPSTFRGRPVWAGPCHGCGERVVVDVEGRIIVGCRTTALRLGTINDVRETVILCVRCDDLARRWSWKMRDDPVRASEVARLAAVRAGRVRDGAVLPRGGAPGGTG